MARCPPRSPQYVDTWALIWFNLVYETILAIPCTMLGLLAFSMEYNYDRVKRTMSMHPRPVRRAYLRIWACIKLFFPEGCCCECECERESGDPPTGLPSELPKPGVQSAALDLEISRAPSPNVDSV